MRQTIILSVYTLRQRTFCLKNMKKITGHFGFALKVIPLKLFYYQTFLKLGAINIHDMNIKKMQLKKWGHLACLHVSGLLK